MIEEINDASGAEVGEMVVPIELHWPENGELKSEYKVGLERINAKINEFQPDVVIALERSGSLAAVGLAVEVVNIPLGRETILGFKYEASGERYAYAIENLIDMTQGDALEEVADLNDEDIDGVKKDFENFIIESLEDGGHGLGKSKNILMEISNGRDVVKIFVVDDWMNQGGTMNLLVPELMRRVFGDDVEIQKELVFQKSGDDWIGGIVESNFGENLDELKSDSRVRVRKALKIFAKGSVDEFDGIGDVEGVEGVMSGLELSEEERGVLEGIGFDKLSVLSKSMKNLLLK